MMKDCFDLPQAKDGARERAAFLPFGNQLKEQCIFSLGFDPLLLSAEFQTEPLVTLWYLLLIIAYYTTPIIQAGMSLIYYQMK